MIVYEAFCVKTGKTYVGLTTKSIKSRKQQHESYARRGSVTHFHKAIRKYGSDSFEWNTVMIANNVDSMKALEVMVISLYEKWQIYNETDGGDGTFGRKASDETRKKISKNHADFRGPKHPRYGKVVSEETRQKIRASLLARSSANNA